jgi:hypothetical protein
MTEWHSTIHFKRALCTSNTAVLQRQNWCSTPTCATEADARGSGLTYEKMLSMLRPLSSCCMIPLMMLKGIGSVRSRHF